MSRISPQHRNCFWPHVLHFNTGTFHRVMEGTDLLLSASRAVLELMERECQPLSSEELELDRAMEELLESEFINRMEAEGHQPPVPVLDPKTRVQHVPAVVETPAQSPPEEQENQEAVKYISALIRSCKSRSRMCGRARLSVSQTVVLSLTLLSERVSYRSVSRRFHLEKGNIHRIFYSFCQHINTLKDRIIRWPVGSEAVNTLCPFSSLLGPADLGPVDAPHVLGILGHTQIPVRLPKGRHRPTADPDPSSWLNLELVCDQRGVFVHCRISRGSDGARGLALRDKLTLNPDLMPPGGCLLAGPGYPLSSQILTPYTGRVGPREELFNRTLQRHLHVVDQSLSRLRARFQRLIFLDVGSHERAVAVTLTCCVLHNVFLELGQEVEGEVEEVETSMETIEEVEDEEGVRRRDAIADALYRKVQQGST